MSDQRPVNFGASRSQTARRPSSKSAVWARRSCSCCSWRHCVLDAANEVAAERLADRGRGQRGACCDLGGECVSFAAELVGGVDPVAEPDRSGLVAAYLTTGQQKLERPARANSLWHRDGEAETVMEAEARWR